MPLGHVRMGLGLLGEATTGGDNSMNASAAGLVESPGAVERPGAVPEPGAVLKPGVVVPRPGVRFGMPGVPSGMPGVVLGMPGAVVVIPGVIEPVIGGKLLFGTARIPGAVAPPVDAPGKALPPSEPVVLWQKTALENADNGRIHRRCRALVMVEISSRMSGLRASCRKRRTGIDFAGGWPHLEVAVSD